MRYRIVKFIYTNYDFYIKVKNKNKTENKIKK